MSGKLSQHEKEKGTYFSVVTNDNYCRSNIKDICIDFPCFAWIDHLPDDENGSPHTHFLLRNNGTRSVKQMADRLDIPSNYVQVVRKVGAFRRYMVHADNPEKRQYSLDDIHSNRLIDFKIALDGNQERSVQDLYSDFRDLACGRISPEDFIDRNFNEVQKMSFGQKIKLFDTLHRYSFKYPETGLPDSPVSVYGVQRSTSNNILNKE